MAYGYPASMEPLAIARVATAAFAASLLFISAVVAKVVDPGWPSPAILVILVVLSLICVAVNLAGQRLFKSYLSSERATARTAAVSGFLLSRVCVSVAPGLYGLVLAFVDHAAGAYWIGLAIALACLAVFFPRTSDVAEITKRLNPPQKAAN